MHGRDHLRNVGTGKSIIFKMYLKEAGCQGVDQSQVEMAVSCDHGNEP